MLKKWLRVLTAAAFLILVCVLGSGCAKIRFVDRLEMTGETEFHAEIGEFDFSQVTFDAYYDDGYIEMLCLTEEMLPSSELLKLYVPGDQTVNFVYHEGKGSITVHVSRHKFDDFFTFEDMTVTYDGNPHALRPEGDLPAGATVKFPNGNTFVDAGVYPIKMMLEKDGYETESATAVLTIEKADYDTSAIAFPDKTVTFDGLEKTHVIPVLPEDLKAEYEFFTEDGKTQLPNAISAGTYQVRATLTPDKPDNYNPIPTKTAKLIIDEATYDMSRIFAEDLTVVYDGEAHPISLQNEAMLPRGVMMSYRYYDVDTGDDFGTNPPVNSGNYKYEATFVGSSNYKPIDPIEADLIIEKIVIDTSNLELFSQTLPYDGAAHSLLIPEETIPAGVRVTYTGNEQTAQGSHTVVATIEAKDKVNYTVNCTELVAELIIEPIITTVSFDPSQISYLPGSGIKVTPTEGTETTVTVSAQDTGEIVTEPHFGILYNYTAEFVFTDPEKAAKYGIEPSRGTVIFFDPAWLPGDMTLTYTGENLIDEYMSYVAMPDNWYGLYSYDIFAEDGSAVYSEAITPRTYLIRITLTRAMNYCGYPLVHEAKLTIANP